MSPTTLISENCVDYTNRTFSQSVAVLAIMCNIFLCLLVRNHTPTMMLSYRKVLYGSCVLDGMAALANFFIVIRPSMEQDVAATNFDGPLPHFIDEMGWLRGGRLGYLIIIEFVLQFNTLSYCFVPFTYRYFHIVHRVDFTKSKFFLLLLAYLWPTSIVAISLPLMASRTYDQMVDYLGPGDPSCLRRIPFFDRRFASVQPIKELAMMTLISMVITFLFPFVLCFFLIRIFKRLNVDVRKASATASRMQWQITLTLTAQSVVPILFVAWPTFYVIYNLSQNKEKTTPLRVFFNSLSLVPLINPITTLMLVKNYRNTMFRAVGLRRFQRKTAVTSVFSKGTVSNGYPIPLEMRRPSLFE